MDTDIRLSGQHRQRLLLLSVGIINDMLNEFDADLHSFGMIDPAGASWRITAAGLAALHQEAQVDDPLKPD